MYVGCRPGCLALVTRATCPEEPRPGCLGRNGVGEAATRQAGNSWAFPLSLPSVPTGAEEVSLEIPANILESSQRAHITVMGKGQPRGPGDHG